MSVWCVPVLHRDPYQLGIFQGFMLCIVVMSRNCLRDDSNRNIRSSKKKNSNLLLSIMFKDKYIFLQKGD